MDIFEMRHGSTENIGRRSFASAISAVLAVLLFCGLMPSVACAASSDTVVPGDPQHSAVEEACPPDTLTIETGYRNWPEDQYEVKKLFTLSEIKTMPTCGMYYTFIDDSNELIIDFTWGICLTDLLSAAGVFVDDVEELIFYAENGNHQQRVTFSKEELIDTQRFCNFSLQQYYDPETGTIREHKRWAKGQVETMLAFEEAWMSPSEVTGFEGEDNLVSDNCFRLVFGQADRLERNMSQAIPHIHTVSVVLIGSAPLPVADKVNDQGNTEELQDTYEVNGSASDTETNDEGTGKASTNLIANDEEPDIIVMPAPLNTLQTSFSSLISTTPAVPLINTGHVTSSVNTTGHSIPVPINQNQGCRMMPASTSLNSSEYLSPVPATQGTEDFEVPLPEAEGIIPSEGGTEQQAESVPVPGLEDGVYKSPDLQRTRRILCLAACALILGIGFNAFLRYLRHRYEKEKKEDQDPSYNGRIQGDLL